MLIKEVVNIVVTLNTTLTLLLRISFLCLNMPFPAEL